MRVWLLTSALLMLHAPSPVMAQLSDPCQFTCAAVLGTSGFVAATGAAVAVGRGTGGMSTVDQGLWVWSGTFAAVVGGGFALAGDGGRQERAIFTGGVGTATGAVVGLVAEAVRTNGDGPRVLAGALMGAAAGAVIGGLYGALTYDSDATQNPIPLFAVSLSF
jgi:hypothetical protein